MATAPRKPSRHIFVDFVLWMISMLAYAGSLWLIDLSLYQALPWRIAAGVVFVCANLAAAFATRHFIRPQHPALIYEHEPKLGDYTYCNQLNSWSHRRATACGVPFSVHGSGRRPTHEQLATWQSVESRLDELFASAVAAVVDPPTRSEEFDRGSLSLSAVWLDRDQTVLIDLDSPLADKIDMFPRVTFVGNDATSSVWIP